MIKRTIEISREPAHLCVRLDQLVLQRDGQTVGQIPCEDLGLVLVDHPRTTYSHSALCSLVESQAALVVCGRDHLPAGLLLPLADHTEVVWRIKEQLAAPKPLHKRLWKQIVQAKIRAQADNLIAGTPERTRLLELARSVRSGDPENCEAQAARRYWSVWLTSYVGRVRDAADFRRDTDGAAPNALLNYGYAIVRAAVARALVGAGLLPVLGIKHCNRSNAFCLADDLIEPLRPMVDAVARELFWAGQTELDQTVKARLLDLLVADVRTGAQTGPLMVALHRYAASLAKCYQGARKDLEIPKPC